MGMFDYIKFEIECPVCKEKVKDFQSKYGPCILKTLEFWEVNNFYASCPKCNSWIEFNRIRPLPKAPIEDYKMEITRKEKDGATKII